MKMLFIFKLKSVAKDSVFIEDSDTPGLLLYLSMHLSSVTESSKVVFDLTSHVTTPTKEHDNCIKL